MAGDFLDIGSMVEPDAQIAVVVEYLSRIAAKTSVVACSGNHDLNDRNAHDERAARWLDDARSRGVIVDGSHFETDELFVTVCPWWDGPRTRAVVDDLLRADAARVGGRDWIWVYHAPADASPTSWTGKRHYGDEDLVTWIGRHEPAMVLSGHVHQSPFATDGAWIDRIGSTVVCNAGQQRGPVPTCIEIDTTARIARWTSLAGVEERDLAAV
jgi:3',5'-cyclic AMP phosphodiesterase CpdA